MKSYVEKENNMWYLYVVQFTAASDEPNLLFFIDYFQLKK